jgi:hypothetical protein
VLTYTNLSFYRADALVLFGDATGQLLRWTFSSNAKLAPLSKLGSKVFCLAAAPAAAPGRQQLQQVCVPLCLLDVQQLERQQCMLL